MLRRTDVGQVLLLLDCCYPAIGEVAADTYFEELRTRIEYYLHVQNASSPSGTAEARWSLTASSPTEEAREKDGRGLFTEALLKALNGDAVDDEGYVTIDTLSPYIHHRISPIQIPGRYGFGHPRQPLWLAHYPQLAKAKIEAERKRLHKEELDAVAMRTARAAREAIITDPDYFDHRATRKRTFDHSLCWDAAISDIDTVKLEHFLQRERVLQQIALHPEETNHLSLFKLVRESIPTYGALLCFGRAPQNWLFGAKTHCILWEGIEQDIIRDRQDLDGDLLSQYDITIQFLRKHLNIQRVRSREEGSDQWEIPFIVLREAVANALIHRDYPDRSDGIYIEVFHDRIEITNPGLLPEGTSPETFLSSGAQGLYRNPLIAEIFYLSGYVEQVGSGIQKMTKEMERSALQPPKFQEFRETRKFKVIFYRPQHNVITVLPNNVSITTSTVASPPPGSAPPLPQLLVGREDDLRLLKERIGIRESGETAAPTKVITAIRGWPGVGKTTLAAALAHDPEIKARFPDGVLWASLGQTPSLFSEIAAWVRALGLTDLAARTLDEASALLRALLRNKRMLLIVDDVWQPEHALPFRVGGSDCTLLITTRLPEVAREVAPSATDIYILGVLTIDNALSLLRELAPLVVADQPEVSRDLVADLEGLPLAIQVAGRLLSAEADLGFDITDLLRDIRNGAKLIEAQAPSDRAEVANETTPTVAALLRKSTDLLNAHDLDCFAYLGAFAPKPATFDAEAMKAVWQEDDPKPTIRELTNRGLLEPAGHGRFWMHAILVTHARSFLTE